MTLNELMQTIPEEQRDLPLVISRDGSGNSFSPLSAACVFGWEADPDHPDQGEIGFVREADITPEDRGHGFTAEDVLDDGVYAIILTPMR